MAAATGTRDFTQGVGFSELPDGTSLVGSAIDSAARRVTLDDGRQLAFGALLLATGADPVRLDIPGAAPSQVCYLRAELDMERG
ncbi:MAG TPA: FAD-dependent oxidoreductase [Steroidobacteraceae bacterium]|nr:FAD-dependent oxidoreductase [Steroidobacteraceae bacterium]